jgi:hypothetical protein
MYKPDKITVNLREIERKTFKRELGGSSEIGAAKKFIDYEGLRVC